MVCLYLRVYSIIFYVVRQVVGGKFFAAGRRASAAGVPGGRCAPGGGLGGLLPLRHWLALPLGYPAGAEPLRHLFDLPL